MLTHSGTDLAVTPGEECCRGSKHEAAMDLQKEKPLDHLSLKMKYLVFTVHKGISSVLFYYYGLNLFNV